VRVMIAIWLGCVLTGAGVSSGVLAGDALTGDRSIRSPTMGDREDGQECNVQIPHHRHGSSRHDLRARSHQGKPDWGWSNHPSHRPQYDRHGRASAPTNKTWRPKARRLSVRKQALACVFVVQTRGATRFGPYFISGPPPTYGNARGMASQMRAVLSNDAVTMRAPSGLKAAEDTSPSRPRRTARGLSGRHRSSSTRAP
jgi:hypothetical protein